MLQIMERPPVSRAMILSCPIDQNCAVYASLALSCLELSQDSTNNDVVNLNEFVVLNGGKGIVEMVQERSPFFVLG